MVYVGARRVLAAKGERPDGSVENHQQYETQRKSSHSQARPVAAEVVSRKHAGRCLPFLDDYTANLVAGFCPRTRGP